MLAVHVSPQVKKKRKRTTDSPLTKPVVKRKKITNITESPLLKKKPKKLKIPDSEVPELIICADQLESDVKPEMKKEIKDEVDKILLSGKITKVEVTDPTHLIPDIKIEASDEVLEHLKKKKKSKIKVEIKEEIIDPEIPQPAIPISNPPKKKKKKTKIPCDTTAQPTPKKVKKKKKSDIVTEHPVTTTEHPVTTTEHPVTTTLIKTEPPDNDYLYNISRPVKQEDLIGEEVEIKNENEEIKDEKAEIKDEKAELKVLQPNFTMFNSDIKQELLAEDHINMHLVRNLNYSDEDPCIHHEVTQIHCALTPVYAGKILEGVDNIMKKHSLKYMKEIRGVLLKYSNIQLLSSTGRYLSTNPEFHFDIKCSTTSFKPKINQVLSGTVVKMGPGYANCLVYGYFTAVVYGRFQTQLVPGTLINFKLRHYQQTSTDDLILKGVPEIDPSS